MPRECTGNSKHPLPTTQEKTLHMDITRWSALKSGDAPVYQILPAHRSKVGVGSSGQVWASPIAYWKGRITHFKGLMVSLLPTTSHLVLQTSPNQDPSCVDSTSLAGTPLPQACHATTAALPTSFLPQALRDKRATIVTLLLSVPLKFLNPHPEPQHSSECG